MSTTPTVCVIGAGLSGLTSTKALLDYGIDTTTIESSDRVGGNWAFGNPNGHSSAYRSLHIDTSKENLSFRDFPIPDDYPDFPHHTQIKAYLDDYADTFDLRSAIRFQTTVEWAVRQDAGGWAITLDTGEVLHRDLLVVANGHHWDPRLPDFDGSFDGIELHSHHYLSPDEPHDLTGKRILVVGIGNSAVDIACELSAKSWRNEVTISTRSGAWVMPKYVFGRPIDRVAPTIPQIPLRWQRLLARPLPTLIQGRPESYGLPTPNHKFQQAHPTVSSELLLRLGSGDLTAKPDVARLEGHTVVFEDDTQADFDAIIYATGYNITFPFFDPDFLSAPDNQLPLFKRMLHPDIPDVVFVGFAQALPTLFPFAEAQTRLLARYAAGTYRPPSPDEMRRIIDADAAVHAGGGYNESARHTQQVDYFVYEHDLRTKELPAGERRAAERGPIRLTRSATGPDADAAAQTTARVV